MTVHMTIDPGRLLVVADSDRAIVTFVDTLIPASETMTLDEAIELVKRVQR